MGKHSNKEAYFKRLQELAEVKKPSLKESTRTIGSLIDFKRGADGVAYGIIKENHHYYIKKGGIKENPDASDFTYIGGLGNITEYQYNKLSDADKNRNMILNMINESYGKKISKDGSISKLNKKRVLTENVEEDASEEIGKAEEKMGDLETATQKAAASEPADALAPEPSPEPMPDMGMGDEPAPDMPEPTPEPDAGEEPMPDVGDAPAPEMGDEPAPDVGGDMAGEPAPEPAPETGDEEMPDLEGLGLDDEAPEGEEKEFDVDMGTEPTDPESGDVAAMEEYTKNVGKLQQSLRELPEISKEQLEDTLKQVLSAYKDKLVDSEMSIEDRKEIARDYIIDVEDAKGEEELGDIGAEEEGDVEAKEIPMPVDSEEEELPMAAEAKNDCSECGSFVQYAESRGYTAESIVEATNEEIANLSAGYIGAHKEGMNEGDFSSVATHLTNEAFDMLKEEYGFDDEELSHYQTALNECGDDDREKRINELWGGLKNIGKEVGKGVARGAEKAWDATKQAGQAVGQAAQQAGDWVGKTYHQGEVGGEVKKIEKMANDLGNQLVALNNRLQKAGQQSINPNSLLRSLANQIAAGQQVDVSRTKAGAGIQRETLDDMAKVETQPSPEFAVEAQVLGVGINESEEKVRKYVRNRLQEMMGIKKPTINENAKSETIKKLDKVIEKQFKLYETVIKKKVKLNEEFEQDLSFYTYETPKVSLIWNGRPQPGLYKSALDALDAIKKSMASGSGSKNVWQIRTPDGVIDVDKELYSDVYTGQ